jgi:hypothetical protein
MRTNSTAQYLRMPLVACIGLLAAGATARAQAINVTSGYLNMGVTTGLLQLGGDRGFATDTRVSAVSGIFNPQRFCNDNPNHCVPGATVDLLAHWEGNDLTGAATLDGTRRRDVDGHRQYDRGRRVDG